MADANSMNYIEQIKAARRASTPIVVIRTADYATVIREVATAYSEKPHPIFQWDISKGVLGVNGDIATEGAALINQNEGGDPPAMVTGNPVEAIQRALAYMPTGGMLFMMNAHILLESRDTDRLPFVQGVWNCRDAFKSSKRMLILLVPDLRTPIELVNDTITIDVPLPNDVELEGIVRKQLKAGKQPDPDSLTLKGAVAAISGLSAFSAEQVTAQSLRREGLDIAEMWGMKRSIIQSVGGLTVESRPVSFDDLGGLDNIKSYFRRIIKGKRKPRLVVLVD